MDYRLNSRAALSVIMCTLVTFSGAAHGQTLCANYVNLVAVFVGSDHKRCEDFGFLDQELGELKILSPVDLSDLTISSGKATAVEAIYDPFSSQIQLDFDPTSPVQIAAARAIFAHEVAHHILTGYLGQKFDFLKELVGLRVAEANLRRKANSANPEERVHLVPLMQQSERSSKRFQSEHGRKMEILAEAANPYEELFADAVAAIYLNDTEAIVTALSQVADRDFSCRSFGDKFPENYTSTDFHCALSGIRFDLWQNWILKRRTDKPALIRDLAELISQEIVLKLRGDLCSTDLERLRERFGLASVSGKR